MTKNLTVGNPFRIIVSYLIPVYFSLLLQSMFSVVDSVTVGQTLGPDALGGISATGNIVSITLYLFAGINTGFCIPISGAFGAGDYSRLRRLIVNSAYLCVGAALFAMVFLAPASGFFLTALNTTKEHYPHALNYLRIMFLGAPFSLMYNLCGNVIRSLGDSKMPTLFLCLSSISNVIMNLIFILVFKMGTAGAALATVLANAIAGFSCLIYMIRKLTVLRFAADEWRPDKTLLSLLIRNGAPMGLQSMLIALGPLIQRPALNGLGANILNSLSVAGALNRVLLCPISTLGHSIGYYFGQNVGAGKSNRIKQGLHTGLALSAIFCVISTLLVFFFSAPMTALVLSNPDDTLLKTVRISLLITNSASVFCGICAVYKHALQAMGHTMLATIPSFVELGLQIFGALVLIPSLGFIGANLSTAASWIVVALCVVPMCYICLCKFQKSHATV